MPRIFATAPAQFSVKPVMPDLFRHPTLGSVYGVRERTPCVYMLASGRYGTIYTGVTSNLIGRVLQHRDGAFDGFIAEHGVKLLVWYEAAELMDAAIAAEKRIKRYRREWKINLIEARNPYWEDLAVALGVPPLK